MNTTIKIKNVFTGAKFKEISHDGVGELEKIRPFSKDSFDTPIDFIDFVTMAPSSQIGLHSHGQNEEVYFIVKGEGEMTIENKKCRVQAGDVILNSVNGTHALVNDTENNIDIFIFQVSLAQ